ncbi:MAG: restriction endonuclease subunit S [Blautia sp.]|nr:restriction endonuclease subunit S [Blautia sp.]
MSKVLLGDVAVEHKETCKGSKDGYPIVGLEHLIPEEITLTAWNEGSENTFSKMFRKGNVLFGRRRAYLKKAAVAPFDGICSGDITVIEAKPDRILPELLPFIIQNDDLFEFAVGKSAGSLSPRVKWEHLKNYEFELPDMGKQKELAELLWAMDNTKKSYQKLIAATDELVKSQFIEWFGDPISVESGAMGKDLFSLASGKANTTANLSDEYEYECYGGNGVTGHSKEYLIKEPTIVIGRVGEYCGSVHITSPFSWITDNAIYITSYDRKRICLDFLYAECKIKDFHRFAATVGQPKITQKPILEDLYIVPPLEEQERFIAFAHQSDKSKFELEKALSELTATYKRIIAENLG